MLKLRRANSPATRARTPGLFSTSTDSMCFRPVRMFPAASRSSSLRISLVPGSPISPRSRLADLGGPRPHHVPGGGAGGDHRIAVLLPAHLDVEHHRPFRLDCLAHRILDLVVLRDPHAGGAIGLRQLDPVGTLTYVHPA